MSTPITLAVLNANRLRTITTWNQYTVDNIYTVGHAARGNRGRFSGAKRHLLSVEMVIAEAGEHKPGTFKIGAASSTMPACGVTMGQHAGQTIPGFDTDRVDCTRCQTIIGRIEARIAGAVVPA